MAYTLAQYSKLTTDPATRYVMTNMLRDFKLADILPFETADSLKVSALRWRNLPDVAFRDLNSDYTEDTQGDVEEVWESLYVLGGLVKFDRIYDLVKGSTVKDPKQLVLDMKIKALALKWNDYLINGDLATDALGFQGLKKRVSLEPTRQKVCATLETDTTGLNVTNSTANANRFWTQIETAHRYCNTGNVSAMFCNETMLLGFGRSLRYMNAAGGYFLDVTKDAYERQVLSYKGTPIIDTGLKKDQSTEIITLTEASGSGATDTTSIYFAAFNTDQGITGVQIRPMEVIPDAKKDVATANQTLIEWVMGLVGFGSYGISRLWNILTPASWTN